jgi:hypothetical protein
MDVFIPDMADMKRAYREEQSARDREEARTIKRMEVAIPLNTTPTSVFTQGPDQGYIWNLKLFSSTLTGADTVQLYKASADKSGIAFEAQKNRLIGAVTTATTFPTVTWSSSQTYIRWGEAVYAETSGSFRFTNYYIVAEQVMAEREARVYD